MLNENTALAWFNIDNTILTPNDVLFTLVMEGDKKNIPTVDLDQTKTGYHQVYDDQLTTYQVKLAEGQTDMSDNDLKVYQNVPNPFSLSTDIYFDIHKDTKVSLEIFSLNGQKLFSKQGLFPKGTNKISIDASSIPLNKGIYYYQIKTQNRSLVRKMIVI
jgi:hypothetical protein